ncbi:MAG: amidohydrolase family protein [Pseudomonadota bacterium]
MNARVLPCHAALIGPEYQTSGPVSLSIEDGVMTSIAPLDSVPDGPRTLVMPGIADAHNHARPLSTTSFGSGFKPLETWLPSLAIMPSVDPYLAALCSLGRSAVGGCTSVMVHLTRPMGQTDIVTEAREIARAAKDVGVSIGFALSMRDRNPLTYKDHTSLLDGLPKAVRAWTEATWLKPLPSLESQMQAINDLAEGLADQPHVDVQYGPAGVHWCSHAMLEAIAEASAHTARRVHMHLLETLPQRAWADETYPQDRFPDGMIGFLDAIGFLSDRVTCAHGVHLRPDEMAILGSRGVRVSINPSSNLHLASGLAPAAQMREAGIDVAMGLDGCAFDEDDDALREMRLFRHLNQGWAFAQGLSRTDVLTAVCQTARKGLGLQQGGTIEIGQPADLLVLDLDALDRDALMRVDPLDYLFTRASRAHLLEVIASGKTIAAGGHLTAVDLDAAQNELRDQYRSGLSNADDFLAQWAELEPHLDTHYKAYQGCC